MERPYKIAICEDIPADAALLRACVESAGFPAETAFYESGEALAEAYAYGMYDIIFFDVYMGGMTGVEAARIVREKDSGCLFVFLTVSRDHAIDAYALEALHYIVKPVTRENVSAALTRCRNRLDEEQTKTCAVTVDRRERNIPHRDILYAEVYGKDCLIHTPLGVICSRTPIDALEGLLPSPPFLRCHRSYIVNMDYIKSVKEDFVMKNGDTVYIRQASRAEIKEAHMRYLMKLSQEREPL